MKIEQKKWVLLTNWQTFFSSFDGHKPQLVFAFGDRFILKDPKRYEELKNFYPEAQIVFASTSGNILGVNLDDQSIITTALAFEKSSTVKVQRINISAALDSYNAGSLLANQLPKEGLKHIFLLADGHLVNGTELVNGILSIIQSSITLSGGLAGDGIRFEKTVVGLNSLPTEGEIVAIGFYGPNLKFGMGSVGGWDPFGMERKITRASKNVLYELDGQSALKLYKKYLGDQAKDLPGSALLFPLAIREHEQAMPLVRTILSINEEEKSMTFAGNIPEGWYAQLMKANFDRLVDGAIQAANFSLEEINSSPDLAILISCVGRRIVLDQRTEEEIESVQDVIGKDVRIIGFYSYGEIAPTNSNSKCELHNQTMTITTITEN